MLGLVASQLRYKLEKKEIQWGKAIWVDVSVKILRNLKYSVGNG